MKYDNLVNEINSYLHNYFKHRDGYEKILYDSMSYSLNVGGKRIRPLLLILTYIRNKEDYSKIMEVACSVEMIHTYSLIHDDLPSMDNDDLRRGKPTNHRVFGVAIATLAGDALLNEAMNILFKNCSDASHIRAAQVISEASSARGMIGGQAIDILSEGREISEDELLKMHEKKTGALIKAPIIAGAILSGTKESEIDKLSIFGEKLGLAFQIKDDILDVTGSETKLGKKVKKDTVHEKNNFITKYGLENCIKKVDIITEECINILKSMENTEDLQEITSFLLKRDY